MFPLIYTLIYVHMHAFDASQTYSPTNFPFFPSVSDNSDTYAHAPGGRWDTALSVAVVVSLNEKWMRLKLDKLKLDQVNLQNVLKVRETAGFTISVCESETDTDVER